MASLAAGPFVLRPSTQPAAHGIIARMIGPNTFAAWLTGPVAILIAPPAAWAQPAIAPTLPAQVSSPASLLPSNSVHCIYDLMSTEDREMALLLFEREVASGTKFHGGSRNLKVIDRLVDEARVKCARPYSWSSGRSDAAISYAMNELMSEGVAQALDNDHRSAL